MTAINFSLLGGFHINDESGHSIAPTARKARALLAYLVLNDGKPQARDKLAALLWGESDENQARTSLRQALTAVRKALSEVDADMLQADQETVSLKLDGADIDVRAFDRGIAAGDFPDLEKAVEAYRGDLLEGFHVSAPAFADWLSGERQVYREQARRALTTLLDHAVATGDHDHGIALGSRLLVMDPLDEAVHRALMRLHLRLGRPAAALKQYRGCRDVLQRELGVMPEPETDALYRTILRQRRESGGREETAKSPPARAESPVDEHPDTTEAPAAPELRQATILTARTPEFINLASELGPEDRRNLTDRLAGLIGGIVRFHGGSVIEALDDGAVAAFGVRTAHSNDPERAVRAAMALHESMPGFGESYGHGFHLKVGVATGRLLVGEGTDAEPAVEGEVLNWAGWLCEVAAQSETLVSDTVWVALADQFDSEMIDAAGELARATRPRRILGEEAAAGEVTIAPFVGRRSEKRQFVAALEMCLSDKTGATISVRGNAGIGKSRLVDEYAMMAEAEGFSIHRTGILDIGFGADRRAMKKIARSLAGVVGQAAGPEWRRTADEISAALALAPPVAAVLNDHLDLDQPPEIAGVFEAMDVEARLRARRRLFNALINARAAETPLLFAIEDVHLAQEISMIDLAGMTRLIAEIPAILLMTTRVDGDPLGAAWRAEASGCSLLTFDLAPLRAEEAHELAQYYAPDDEGLREDCVVRAEGNPLFLEQLLKIGPTGGDELPGSMQSVVLERMDRLEPLERRALQAAAVLGMRFEIGALRHLIDEPGYTCRNLLAQGLVRPKGELFHFAHTFIHECVYTSQPAPRLKKLHAKAAAWFRERNLPLHAHHLDKANDPSAANAYRLAAEAKSREGRHEMVRRMAARGREVAKDETLKYDLSMLEAQALVRRGNPEAALAAFHGALDGAPGDIAKSWSWLWIADCLRLLDRTTGALSALKQSEEAAGRNAPSELLARFFTLRGNILFPLGDVDGCMRDHRLAQAAAELAGSHELTALALSGLADAHYQRGQMATANALFDDVVAMARDNQFMRIESANLQMRGLTSFYLCQVEAALADAKSGLNMALRTEDWRGEALSRIVLGTIHNACGRHRDVLDTLERALDLSRWLGTWRFEADSLMQLGLAHFALGERAKSLSLLRQAWAIFEEHGKSYAGAWLAGCIALAESDPASRENALAQGEEVLADECVSHNHLHFRNAAMELACRQENWKEAERQADALAEYTAAEPLPWSDMIIARTRARAALAQNAQDQGAAKQLAAAEAQASAAGLKFGGMAG